jgi:hypothetical protein
MSRIPQSRQLAHRWRLGCQPYAPAALYPQKDLLVLISVTGRVNPRAMARLEGLGKFKRKWMTSSKLEYPTLRLVALRLDYLPCGVVCPDGRSSVKS